MASAPRRVPPGHRVTLISATPQPMLRALTGGALLAASGEGASLASLEQLVVGVERALDRPPRSPRVVDPPLPLADLLPHLPPLLCPDDFIVWHLTAGVLEACVREPAAGASWLERIRQVGWRRGLDRMRQCVYLPETSSPEALTAATRLQGFGLEVRTPEPGGELLAEVQTPDASILTVRMGEVRALPPAPAFPATTPPPLRRSPCLRALVGIPDDTALLGVELAAEHHALLLLADLDRQGRTSLPARGFKGFGDAMPVYPDLETFESAARSFGKKSGQYAPVVMAPRALVRWAIEQSTALAWAHPTAGGELTFRMMPVGQVRELAQHADETRSRG